MISDGELVKQTRAGRSSAGDELARRWAGRIAALCHQRVRGAGPVEDLAQETLLRGYRALATLHDPEKFGPWLRGIAVRTCLDWLKSRKRSMVPLSTLGLADGLLDERSAVENDDEIDRLRTAIGVLPSVFRQVLRLHYYEGLTHLDIARRLGVSAATVNARLVRARGLLRRALRRRVDWTR